MKLDIVESSGDGGFALPIPPKLAKPLLAFLRRPRKPSVKSDVTSVISQLVQQIDARITSVRLSKVMKHELTLLGIDEVDVALLSGIAAEHCAGLYYSTVPRERLAKTYYRYVSLLLRGHPDKNALKWRTSACLSALQLFRNVLRERESVCGNVQIVNDGIDGND